MCELRYVPMSVRHEKIGDVPVIPKNGLAAKKRIAVGCHFTLEGRLHGRFEALAVDLRDIKDDQDDPPTTTKCVHSFNKSSRKFSLVVRNLANRDGVFCVKFC